MNLQLEASKDRPSGRQWLATVCIAWERTLFVKSVVGLQRNPSKAEYGLNASLS